MTTSSFVFVPINENVYANLIVFLNANRDPRSPNEVASDAIDYWLDNAEWKKDTLLHVPATTNGYTWKQVFLPHGTRVRMKYKGEYSYAAVSEDEFIFNEQSVSPSEFANLVTGTSRNAWRDLEVRRPNDDQWHLADNLRKEADHPATQFEKRTAANLSTIILADQGLDEEKLAWWEIVMQALEELGGEAVLSDLYTRVRKICSDTNKRIPESLEAIVRGTLEDNSSDSERYKRRRDVFTMPCGRGAGIWAVRKNR